MMMVVMFWRNNAMCWLSKRWRMEMGLRIGVDGQCKKQPALYITAGGILYCTLYNIHYTHSTMHIGTLAQLRCTKTLVVGPSFTSRRVVGLPLPLLLVTAVVILCFSKCHAVGQVTAVVWGGTGRGGDKKSVTGVEISGDHLWPNIEL